MISRIKNKLKSTLSSDQKSTDLLLQSKHKDLELKDSMILGFSAGRSGQRWMAELFAAHQNCNGGCERLSEFEAFFRYVTWHGLDIDMEGFYQRMEMLIKEDFKDSNISFNGSPFFSFGVKELCSRFNPDYIFFQIRNPLDVVNSLFVKGWYQGPLYHADYSKLSGPQPFMSDKLYHSFSRVTPNGEFKKEWDGLTRIGKISWYYATVNSYILDSINAVNGIPKWYMKLSDVNQNYDYYRLLTETFSLRPILSESQYIGLKDSKGNKGKKQHSYSDWTSIEKEEYHRFIDDLIPVYEGMKTSGL